MLVSGVVGDMAKPPSLVWRFHSSQAAAWRYVDQTLEVLAAWAPGLNEALVGLGGGDFVIIEGTLIPTDRIRADEPYQSQKHRLHGTTVQVIARPDRYTPVVLPRAAGPHA